MTLLTFLYICPPCASPFSLKVVIFEILWCNREVFRSLYLRKLLSMPLNIFIPFTTGGTRVCQGYAYVCNIHDLRQIHFSLYRCLFVGPPSFLVFNLQVPQFLRCLMKSGTERVSAQGWMPSRMARIERLFRSYFEKSLYEQLYWAKLYRAHNGGPWLII